MQAGLGGSCFDRLPLAELAYHDARPSGACTGTPKASIALMQLAAVRHHYDDQLAVNFLSHRQLPHQHPDALH